MGVRSKRLLQSAVIGLAVIGVLLSIAFGAIWAHLYNNPCEAYSWERESGQLLVTQFEPELCFKGGPRQRFTGTLRFTASHMLFSSDADTATGDGSWVPARLPGIFQQYLLDHVATPGRDGRALLRVRFVGRKLDRYSTPFFRMYTLDGPGDTVIYIERLTRVEQVRE